MSQRGFLRNSIPVISEAEKKDSFEIAMCVEGYKSRNNRRHPFEKGRTALLTGVQTIRKK